MRFSTAIAATALAAGVSASNYTETPVYTTDVVTEFTTYCPGPTQITHGGSTYTVTSETTLTITNCPCTITYPVSSSAPTVVPPPVTSALSPVSSAPVYTPAPYTNGTTSAYTPTSAPSSVPVSYTPTGSPIPTPTGAANRAVAASGAGLAAVLGFVAYVL